MGVGYQRLCFAKMNAVESGCRFKGEIYKATFRKGEAIIILILIKSDCELFMNFFKGLFKSVFFENKMFRV